MARSEQGVNAELRRLHCGIKDNQQLRALAQALSRAETIVDAVRVVNVDNSETTFVVTGEEIVWITHQPSWWNDGKTAVQSLYWQDIAEIKMDGASLGVLGYGKAGRLDMAIDRGTAESERFKDFVQGLRNRLATETSPRAHPAPPPNDSLIGKFDRLAVLRAQGHIGKKDHESAQGRLLQDC